jgi:hypothetical protein
VAGNILQDVEVIDFSGTPEVIVGDQFSATGPYQSFLRVNKDPSQNLPLQFTSYRTYYITEGGRQQYKLTKLIIIAYIHFTCNFNKES